MPLRPIGVLACCLLISAAQLPPKGPVPEDKPETDQPKAEQSVPDVPKPIEKPAQPAQSPPEPKKEDGTPPVPTPPQAPPPEPAPAPAPAPAPEPAPPADPPVVKEDAAALKACLAELSALGAQFSEKPGIDDKGGCGIEKPISVSRIAPDIALKPEGLMRCETALALSRWVKTSVTPALDVAKPGVKLTAVNQASTYICRNRNSADEGKMSEHARGNAVDIASFSLSAAEPIVMETLEDRQRDHVTTLAAAFQQAISATACLYFTTVLSPGSDPTHQDHMHLDVIDRKNASRYCK